MSGRHVRAHSRAPLRGSVKAPLSRANVTILDACVVINLYACGRMEAILDAVPGQVAIADRVVAEARYDPSADPAVTTETTERVELLSLIDRGTLRVVSAVNDDELNTFIDLTVDLDDGEAMTLALAIHRGYTVATDDRPAIRILAGRVPLRSTLDLVKAWVEQNAIAPDTTRQVLTNLRVHGRYLPGRSHPLKSWWDSFMGLS